MYRLSELNLCVGDVVKISNYGGSKDYRVTKIGTKDCLEYLAGKKWAQVKCNWNGQPIWEIVSRVAPLAIGDIL